MKKKPQLGGNPLFTVCFFHNTGGCTKSSCKYQHPSPPLNEKGDLIVCRQDRTGKICREDCVFRHPSREANREQPNDLRDVLSPPSVMFNRRVLLTDTPPSQNANQQSSKSEPTPGPSKKPKGVLSGYKALVRSNEAANAVKRKSSSCGEASSGPSRKLFKSHSEPRFEENGYYKVNIAGDNSSDLKVCDQDRVKFKEYITGRQGPPLLVVENELDDDVVIPSSSLDKRIGLSACPRSCLFTHCKDAKFSSEKPYMEHLILEHFYDKFANLLKSSYCEADKRYRCPQQNCSESFSDIRDICLHYGGAPHAKVIGFLFNSAEISVSQNGKEDRSKISDLTKKLAEKEEELKRLKSSHMNHLTVKDEEIDDQKKKVEILTSKLQETEAKSKSQDAQLKDLEKRLTEKGAKSKYQEKNLNELVVKMNNQEIKLKNQEMKIRDQYAKIKEVEAEMKGKLKDNEQLQNELKEKNIAMKKVEESKVETELNNKLKKENEELKKSVRNMEALNLSVKNTMHKTNLENNQKSVTAKKEFQQKEKELQKKVVTLEAEKTKLEKIISQSRESQTKNESEYQKLREEFESQSADLTNFQSDIEASNKEKEELLGSLNARTSEANKFEREKEELQENLKKMEEERDNLDEDNSRLSGQIKLLKKQLIDFNRNNLEEKEVERTEPTSVPVVGVVDSESEQKLLKVKADLEAFLRERDQMMNLLQTKDEKIKHMEEEILPFVRAWCQQQ